MTRTNPKARIKQLSLLVMALCLSLMPQTQASASEQDDLRKLDIRFGRAYRGNQREEAAKALTEIATRFPAMLQRYPPESVLRTAIPRSTASPQERGAQLALMQRLFAQHFKGEMGIEPSGLWLAFVSALVEEGRVSEAVDVVPRIQTARAAVVLRVDRRFEAVMQRSPHALSVEEIAKLDVLNRRAVVLNYPRSLDAILRLGDALMTAGEFEQALATADAAIEKAAGAKAPRSIYDDADGSLTWLYQNRVDALRALGRWSDAEVAGRKSMELPEKDGSHISNSINLAGFYIQIGRADAAVAALRSVANDRRVSPYGRMQVKSVLCRAAIFRNDEAAVRKAMEYMSEHRNDAPRTYQSMLVWTNQPDEWAQYMIERLRSPRTRDSALTDMQSYAIAPAQHPTEIERRKRLSEFTDRADVRAVVADVGVIDRFSILPP